MSGQTFVITLQGSAYLTNSIWQISHPFHACLATTITLHFKQLRHAAEPGFLTVQSLPLNQADFLQSALFVSVSNSRGVTLKCYWVETRVEFLAPLWTWWETSLAEGKRRDLALACFMNFNRCKAMNKTSQWIVHWEREEVDTWKKTQAMFE